MTAVRGFFFIRNGEVGAMRIVRKINNSAAVAQDSRGKELIVIGKGIGFPAVPYELTDMSRIDRTFTISTRVILR